MTKQIKAIETRYKGYRFRSRLEARWAVFFDAIGWRWEYEPEGYDLGAAGRYLPDFLLRGESENGAPFLFVEVKASTPDAAERSKAESLAYASGIPVVFAIGLPDPWSVSGGLWGYDPEVAGTRPEKTGRAVEGLASLNTYCFRKWGRPGWMLYDSPDSEDQRACDAARSARFEHGESGARA